MNFVEPSVTLINESDNFKRIEAAGRTCYSPNTDILTENGWKNITDVKPDEKVLTYNKDKNSIQYEISNMLCKQYKGELYKSNHSFINFEVTDDHRMFVSPGSTRNYRFVLAKDLSNGYRGNNNRWRFPLYFENVLCNNNDYNDTITYTCSVKNGFRAPSEDSWTFKVNDDIITLIGAYVSEGFIKDGRGKGCGSCVTITQSDGPFLDKIIQSIKNLGLRYNVDSDPRKPHIKHVHFGRFIHVYAFDNMCSHYSKNVHLPEWFRKLSKRQMELLLEILYLGDGSHNTTRSENYISISSRLRDEVQELFVLIGRCASNHGTFVTERKRDSYIVLQNQIETFYYEGPVYCPSTDSGIVCVRYDGKPIWCGNCYKSEDKITDGSAYPFFQRIVKRGHTSVLEHSVIFVRTHTPEAYRWLLSILNSYVEDTGYQHYIRYSNWDQSEILYSPKTKGANLHLGFCSGSEYLFSGSIRAWRKICEKYTGESILHDTFYKHPAFEDIYENYKDDGIIEYLPSEIEIVDSIPLDPNEFYDSYKHNIVTLKIIADRGLIDEYARHRVCGISIESTRYCNYSNNGVTFVFPYWYENIHNDPVSASLAGMFGNRCYDTEVAYQEMMRKCKIPQMARGNLTLWVKSEGAFTATIQQWIDIIALRDSPAAHPEAQRIAKMIEKVLVEQVGVKDIWRITENANEQQ